MTDTKRRQDPIDSALKRVRQADWHRQHGDENPPSDERLRATRLACTALLKLSYEDRQKVLAAAEALGV